VVAVKNNSIGWQLVQNGKFTFSRDDLFKKYFRGFKNIIFAQQNCKSYQSDAVLVIIRTPAWEKPKF